VKETSEPKGSNLMSRSLLSAAIADARYVFPQPGGPYSRRPERERSFTWAKSSGYKLGHRKVSSTIFFVSASPPTSLNLMSGQLAKLIPCKNDGVKFSLARSRSRARKRVDGASGLYAFEKTKHKKPTALDDAKNQVAAYKMSRALQKLVHVLATKPL
jgi:hypothetical protein